MISYSTASAAAFFLAPAAGRSQDLTECLAATKLPPAFRIAWRVDRPLPKLDPLTGAALPLPACPFVATIFAHGPAERTQHVFDDLIASMADMIDSAASHLVAGVEHIVKPGSGSTLCMMLVRRRADFTNEAFHRRWLEGHAPFGLRIPASGYRQLHAEPGTSTQQNAMNRFDGVGIVFFEDGDQVSHARAGAEIARDATRDEMEFIDHARSMLALFKLSD